MAKRLTRTEAQAVTKARLISAARRVFAQQGFEGASVDAIAEEAGMTKGAIYSNFATKEDLFLSVLDDCMDREEQTLEAIFTEQPQSRMEALHHYLTSAPDQQKGDWELLAAEFWLYAARKPVLRAQLATRYRTRRAKIAQFVERYLTDMDRALPAPAESLASAIIALASGLEMQWIIDPEAIPHDLLSAILTVLLEDSTKVDATQHA